MLSDPSSLSFRVGHCHRQLLSMNMYITGEKFSMLSTNRYNIHMLHHIKIHKLINGTVKTKEGYGQTTLKKQMSE